MSCFRFINLYLKIKVLLKYIYFFHLIQIELDGLKATEKEIDTVSVLQALKQAREELKSSSTSDDLQVVLF